MRYAALLCILLPRLVCFSAQAEFKNPISAPLNPADSSAVSDTISIAVDSLPQISYVDTSVRLSEALDFKNEFMLAAEYYKGKKDSMAMEILSHISTTELLAEHYKNFLIFNIHMRNKQYKKADSILTSSSDKAENSEWKRFFQKRRLQIYPFLSFSKDQELAFLKAQLKEEKSKNIKAGLIWRILNLNGFDGGLGTNDDLVKSLFSLNYYSPEIDSVYELIIKRNTNTKLTVEIELMLADYERGRNKFKEAMDRCERIIKSSKSKADLKRAKRLQADLHYIKQDYKKAVEYYKIYLNEYGNNMDVMSNMARAYARMGDGASSKLWYKKIIEAFPRHKKVADIYWMWAWDEEDDKKYDEAVELYNKLLPQFLDNERGRWVNFRIGYIHYKRNEYSKAIAFFQKAQAQKNGRMAVPAGMYWEAKILEKTGKKDSSYKKYLDTYKIYPTSFYGYMAKEALGKAGKWTSQLEDSTIFHTCSEDSLKEWLMDLSSLSREPDSNFISRYINLEDLFKAGLDSLAYTTFDIFYNHESKNPVFLYEYSEQFADSWDEKSYDLARKLSYRISPDKWGEVPAKVLKLIFPKPFIGLVKYYSIRFGQDQNLMYALMKQESGFTPKIASSAGALGLMQVMPATGSTLAKMEKIENHKTKDLLNPEINIRLGTRYLYNLEKKYNNDLPKILCNYNAGPKPTKRWSDKHGEKPIDIFAEEIGYMETRDYVKKVMGNYWTYQSLYSRD